MRTSLLFLCSLAVVLVLTGCTQSPQLPEQDFFDKWEKVAKESEGHSPEHEVDVQELGEEVFESSTLQEDPKANGAAGRSLPTQPVTLKLQNPTSIRTVLR